MCKLSVPLEVLELHYIKDATSVLSLMLVIGLCDSSINFYKFCVIFKQEDRILYINALVDFKFFPIFFCQLIELRDRFYILFCVRNFTLNFLQFFLISWQW